MYNVSSICCINMVLMVVLYAVSCVSASVWAQCDSYMASIQRNWITIDVFPYDIAKVVCGLMIVQVVNGASKNLQKGDMFLMIYDSINTETAKVCSEWQQMYCVAVVTSAVSCCCIVARPGSWQPDLPAVAHWRADHIDKGEPNRPAESRKGERLAADRSCWSVW